ncbi:MAG TPA: hypothetical protein VGH76_04665 [Actinomycetospora sp.]|uniref:hypothetical protein n=1 Tax=Actinomycetospora sp. TaxID=1872135 RepID=UPI002F4152D0
MTGFFVPGVDPDGAESRYADLAATVGATVAAPSERVRWIRFVQGAEEWSAVVGERLSGEMTARTAGRTVRRASAPTRRVSDPATVQAIFAAEESYLVVTDVHPVGDVHDSTWDNPVTVPRRNARQVVRFDG